MKGKLAAPADMLHAHAHRRGTGRARGHDTSRHGCSSRLPPALVLSAPPPRHVPTGAASRPMAVWLSALSGCVQGGTLRDVLVKQLEEVRGPCASAAHRAASASAGCTNAACVHAVRSTTTRIVMCVVYHLGPWARSRGGRREACSMQTRQLREEGSSPPPGHSPGACASRGRRPCGLRLLLGRVAPQKHPTTTSHHPHTTRHRTPNPSVRRAGPRPVHCV